MKILIAVPTYENIYPDTYKSIYDLDRGGHDVDFAFVRGYDVAAARNRIAQMSLDRGADYVLMVDNDVVLPKSVLVDMLDDPKPVCLGYYAHRDTDNLYRGRVSVCRLRGPDGELYANYPLESEYTAEEMGRKKEAGEKKLWIHGGGMGCALIRTDVFRKIDYPWYKWVQYEDSKRGMLSEDLYFCEACKKIGIPVFTDVRAGCGHILRHTQWPTWVRPAGSYRVLSMFDDLQDRVPTKHGSVSWRYLPGDVYPRNGASPLPERIAELASAKNALGRPLIEAIPEAEPAEEAPAAEPEEAPAAEPEPEAPPVRKSSRKRKKE